MGFEVVVRPVVLPNIRPPKPNVLAKSDNPESGIAVLSGGGGKFIGTSMSFSFSISQQMPAAEVKRQVDVERVYQKNDDGTINRDNFVDVNRLKKVRLEDGTAQTIHYATPEKPDNVKILETNKEIKAGA